MVILLYYIVSGATQKLTNTCSLRHHLLSNLRHLGQFPCYFLSRVLPELLLCPPIPQKRVRVLKGPLLLLIHSFVHLPEGRMILVHSSQFLWHYGLPVVTPVILVSLQFYPEDSMAMQRYFFLRYA